MASEIMLLDFIKKEAVRIYPGITIVSRRTQEEERLDISDQIPMLNGYFAVNNSTVCFVTSNEMYVTPYTNQVIESLMATGLKKSNFYVPFSNCDYPKEQKEKWEALRKSAKDKLEAEFSEECVCFSDENHIGLLRKETLKRCLKIPTNGIEVSKDGKNTRYYPIISSTTVDYTVVSNIGKFSAKNGVVIFTYRDGSTYLTKGDRIIKELEGAGYKRHNFFVPLSNGEKIMEAHIQKIWNLIHE